MTCGSCEYLDYDDKTDQYWCGLCHLQKKPLKRWINGIDTPMWCKKDYKTLLDARNEIHILIKTLKTDYVDDIKAYKELEEVGDLMDAHEILMNHFVEDLKLL